MTNKEKFKEVFGLEIDDTSDYGFFDCTDRCVRIALLKIQRIGGTQNIRR